MPAGTMDPPPGVNIVDTGPPKPPPPPTSEIRVSGIPAPASPPPPPKKGSAMADFQKALQSKAGKAETPQNVPRGTNDQSPSDASLQPKAGTDTAPPNEDGSPPQDPSSPKPEAKETVPPPAKPEAAKPGKPNPWKLVEEYKAKATKAETELLEARKQVVPEADRKTFEEKIKATEARNKELEDEIRYVNYEKSADFQKNFHEPYENTFRSALADLKEVPLRDPQTNQVRPLTGDDLAQLAFMSVAQAKSVVNEVCPDFANELMAARRDIRSAWDKRQAALKDAKENGSKRDSDRADQFKQATSALQTAIKQTWDTVNSKALEDPENGAYFKPREGDQEWNQRLAKGFERVDRAWTENPANPRLTPDERASVIKRHAAVRMRAAGWGALKYENGLLKAELAAIKKDLGKYTSTEPTAAGTQPNGHESTPGSARDQVMAAFRKKAGV